MEVQKTKEYLFIVNDGPYGNERPYNALRLAVNLVKREGTHVRVFLLGDAVQCAIKGQETPQGYYNVERMAVAVLRGGEVAT
ncbi:MAG: DsrE family protein [Anaerolineaceae bacterium]|nr:DsrE family protein [Anaerolineaceae bacterium]MBN2677582.1 DsrE family protein [Anaerolineaceae bacterium]